MHTVDKYVFELFSNNGFDIVGARFRLKRCLAIVLSATWHKELNVKHAIRSLWTKRSNALSC